MASSGGSFLFVVLDTFNLKTHLLVLGNHIISLMINLPPLFFFSRFLFIFIFVFWINYFLPPLFYLFAFFYFLDNIANLFSNPSFHEFFLTVRIFLLNINSFFKSFSYNSEEINHSYIYFLSELSLSFKSFFVCFGLWFSKFSLNVFAVPWLSVHITEWGTYKAIGMLVCFLMAGELHYRVVF